MSDAPSPPKLEDNQSVWKQWVVSVKMYAQQGEPGSSGERGDDLVRVLRKAVEACNGVPTMDWLIQPIFEVLATVRDTMTDWEMDHEIEITEKCARALTVFALGHPGSAKLVPVRYQRYVSEIIVYHLVTANKEEIAAFDQFMAVASPSFTEMLSSDFKGREKYDFLNMRQDAGYPGKIPRGVLDNPQGGTHEVALQ